MTTDARRGQRLGIDSVVVVAIRNQLRMAPAAIGAPRQNELMHLLKMPKPRLALCQLGGEVVAIGTAGDVRSFFRMLTIQSGEHRARSHSAGEDAWPQKRSLQRRFAIDAGQTRQLPNGIQSGDWLLLVVEHPTIQINCHASHALACQGISLHGVERRGRDRRRRLVGVRRPIGTKPVKIVVRPFFHQLVVAFDGLDKVLRGQACFLRQLIQRAR